MRIFYLLSELLIVAFILQHPSEDYNLAVYTVFAHATCHIMAMPIFTSSRSDLVNHNVVTFWHVDTDVVTL